MSERLREDDTIELLDMLEHLGIRSADANIMPDNHVDEYVKRMYYRQLKPKDLAPAFTPTGEIQEV